MGAEDSLVLAGCRAFHHYLEEQGIPHGYTEHPGVGHDLARLTQRTGHEPIAFAFRHFGIPTPG